MPINFNAKKLNALFNVPRSFGNILHIANVFHFIDWENLASPDYSWNFLANKLFSYEVYYVTIF